MPPKSKILTKSDFKVAQSCPTKLYYKKNDYTVSNENDFMEHLAEGGYKVGKLANIYYPEGQYIDHYSGIDYAIEETKQLLTNDNITLFEAAIFVNDKLAVIDILKKNGNKVELIEVKSSGVGKEFKYKDWIEELEDVAFQKLVLTEAYPEFNIKSLLFLPDKDKKTSIDKLNSQFIVNANGAVTDIEFTGDPEKVRKDELMSLISVDDYADKIIPEIQAPIHDYIDSLQEGEKIQVPLSKECFKCEFFDAEQKHKSGYHECWGEKAEVEPHIKNIYYIGSNKKNKESLANNLIAENKLSIYDIDLDDLRSTRGRRQKIQIEYTRRNEEWVSDELQGLLEGYEYPLHFIDFETLSPAIPFYKGMTPYEVIAYQWSCHSILKPGGELIHNEYLNTEDKFPNFEFAETLKDLIGLEGTFFMWATHENTTLRKIYHQAVERGRDELRDWLGKVAKIDKDDKNDLSMFVDMNQLTIDHYFHPSMKGSTSIKSVLPAVLETTDSERIKNWLEELELLQTIENGIIRNPYELLPDIEISGEIFSLNNGTDAIKAYEKMISESNDANRKEIAEALIRYCRLDTLAMVIIWEHWVNQNII